jgi:predicted RNA-binding Zn-ribbon protein involved in translation (DUF1610 family)
MALLALFHPVGLLGTVILDSSLYTVAPGQELKLKSRSVRMCCPECGESMYRSDRKEDWHIDKSGFAQFSCKNPDCGERPRYRRVDVLTKAMEANEQSRVDKLAQEHIAFEQLTELENRLTIWIREQYPDYLRGQFPNVAEIAIYVMSGGKEGKVIGLPPQGPTAA